MSLTPEQSGASLPSATQVTRPGQVGFPPLRMPSQVQQVPRPGQVASPTLGMPSQSALLPPITLNYITNAVNQLRTNGPFMKSLTPLTYKILAPLISKSNSIIENAQKLQKKVRAESTNESANESANAETQEGGMLAAKRPVAAKKPSPPLSQEEISRYQTLIKEIGANQNLVNTLVSVANVLMQPLNSNLDALNKLIEAPAASYGPPNNTSEIAENEAQEGGRRHRTRRRKAKKSSRMKKRK